MPGLALHINIYSERDALSAKLLNKGEHHGTLKIIIYLQQFYDLDTDLHYVRFP